MNKKITIFLLFFFSGIFVAVAQLKVPKVPVDSAEIIKSSQWKGKRVAFLGDSMTDIRRKNETCIYWEYLSETLGLIPSVYGISGNQWTGIYKQAQKLKEEKGDDIDAILIFAGTNDYNNSVSIGSFFKESTKQTNHNGKEVVRKFRTPLMEDSTFCGRINKVLSYLKENYPYKQIILLTPIHRGYARFSDTNVQPDEYFANSKGFYIDDYVEVIRKASSIWSVPVIDLFSISGLQPMIESNVQFFYNKDTDRLHLNALGDYRLAKTIQFQLLAFPANFDK